VSADVASGGAPPTADRGLLFRDRMRSRYRRPTSPATGFRRGFGPLGVDVVPLAVVVDVVALVGAHYITALSARASVMLAVLTLVLNATGGHYRARVAPSLLDELPGLAARALVAGALTSAVKLQVGIPVGNGPIDAALVFLALAAVGRAVGYCYVRHYRTVAGQGRATIIVGCGRVGNQLAETLLNHPEYGLSPVGYVDDEPLVPAAERHIPLLGGTASLTDLLLEHRIRNVIVAFMSSRESVMVDMLRTCDRLKCEIFFVPRLYELHGQGPETEVIWGMPLTRLSRASYRSLTWKTKRVFDFLLASIGLIVLSPLLAVCALAVRLEGGPGVIFRQERVGLDGRRFAVLKFRSYKPTDDTESASRWTIATDSRLGPVGRTLRTLSLDELPQLWNVVRGDMSLVGPRPERPVFVDEFTKRFPRYMARHRVPAGLTGWAQVNGLRGDTDIADRASFDNYYIENWSMWTDVKIILRTITQVIARKGR
jgi:exopolysaccharide biosynthesis polyprenyl glycosylphosphotransferase